MTNVQMNAADEAIEEVTTDEATTEATISAYVPTEAPSVTAFADAMAQLINRALALPDGGMKKQTNFRNGLPIPVLGGMVAEGQSYKKTHLIVMTLEDGTQYTFDVRRSRTVAEAAFAIEAAERQMRQDDGAPSMEGDDLPSAALAVQAIVEREGITLSPEIAASVAAIAEADKDAAHDFFFASPPWEENGADSSDDFLSQQTGTYGAARREDAEDAAAEFAAEQAAESATFLHGGPSEADEQEDDEESDEDSDHDDESDDDSETYEREPEFVDREDDDEPITPDDDDEQQYEPYHED